MIGPNISPLMLIQLSLENPELVASFMAAQGREPPANGLQLASAMTNNNAGMAADARADASMQPSGLAPLTEQLMQPQASAPAPAAPAPAMRMADAPPHAGTMNTAAALPAMPAPAATPAPAGATSPMDSIASAMAGIAPSVAGGGAPQRIPFAPAPFIQGALNPQTAEILKMLLQSGGPVVPSIGQTLMGGR